MKKIKMFLLLISCFIFSMARVKAAEIQYCQYDIKDGVPYIIGDCDHYFELKDDGRNKYCQYVGGYNGPSYLNGHDYSGISVTTYNNFINTCPDFLIQDKMNDDREIRTNTVGNRGYELTSDKYFPEGLQYMNYTYYCKVDSDLANWCTVPTTTEYYTINQGYDSSEEALTCQYSKNDELSLQLYCYYNEGFCYDQSREHWGSETLKTHITKFMTDGHYYCPKVKVTSSGVYADVESQIFNSSSTTPEQNPSNNETVKYCNYDKIKDDKGNIYLMRLILTYGGDSQVKNITYTLDKECAESGCWAQPVSIEDWGFDEYKVRLMACYNNHEYGGCPSIKIKGNYITMADCVSNVKVSGADSSLGTMSSQPGIGNSTITPGKENDKYSNIETCTDVDVNHIKACGCIPAEVADITSKVYFVLRLIGPIALLIIGGFEMAKAVASQDESSIEKAKKKLVNKFIAAAAIFLVLTIIKLGVSLVADNPDSMFECVKILLDGYVI